MRHKFQLPEGDEAYLSAQGFSWETIEEGGMQWLLIHEFPAPAGYNHQSASAAIQIPPGYPDSPLDMVYLHPALVRVDGRPIPAADAKQALDGKEWQRWSRHRTGAHPWRPGVDDVSVHVMMISDWLAREFHRA